MMVTSFRYHGWSTTPMEKSFPLPLRSRALQFIETDDRHEENAGGFREMLERGALLMRMFCGSLSDPNSKEGDMAGGRQEG